MYGIRQSQWQLCLPSLIFTQFLDSLVQGNFKLCVISQVAYYLGLSSLLTKCRIILVLFACSTLDSLVKGKNFEYHGDGRFVLSLKYHIISISLRCSPRVWHKVILRYHIIAGFTPLFYFYESGTRGSLSKVLCRVFFASFNLSYDLRLFSASPTLGSLALGQSSKWRGLLQDFLARDENFYFMNISHLRWRGWRSY